MTKIYNKIELVGSWTINQLISSGVRKSPETLQEIYLSAAVNTLYKHLCRAVISYMDEDKYLYHYEIQLTRQKQDPSK